MKTTPWLLACALAAISACSSHAPTSSPEAVVEAAFTAIKHGDWEAYAKLTVTSADFILKEQNASSPFKQKQGYAGSVLKPEEIARQKKDFYRAAMGAEGTLDFRNGKFGKAVLAGSGTQETLSGGQIPVTAYLVALDGQSAPSPAGPGFVIVKWNVGYKLLGLSFPSEEAQATEAGASPAS